MTTKKNPFAGYQAEKTGARESLITRYLGSLRRTRAKYEYVTDLAKAVAEQISLTEGAPCSPSTILRNKRYKALLLNFMATQAGLGAVAVTDSATQLKVTAAELEASNLKRENERLHTYITDLEKRLDASKSPLRPSPIDGSLPDVAEIANKHALTCKALWLVLDHFKDILALDADGQKIIDLAAPKKNNVVADAAVTQGFLEWLQTNQAVG